MFITELMPIISRWLHIIFATILVGGTLFLRFSLVPALKGVAENQELREAIRQRWAKMVGLSAAFLLASGFYNFILRALDYKLSGMYLGLIGVKILLAFVIFLLVMLLAGRSDNAKKFREKELYFLNITCVLMVILVCMAGFLKMSNQIPKAPPTPERTSATTSVQALHPGTNEHVSIQIFVWQKT